MIFDVNYPQEGAAVITANGRLNMVAAPRLRELITSTVNEKRCSRVVIDLNETEFIDSSGLGALIAGLKTARTAGGDLRIARPQAQITTVLELTNMHRVLRSYTSVAEGLA